MDDNLGNVCLPKFIEITPKNVRSAYCSAGENVKELGLGPHENIYHRVDICRLRVTDKGGESGCSSLWIAGVEYSTSPHSACSSFSPYCYFLQAPYRVTLHQTSENGRTILKMNKELMLKDACTCLSDETNISMPYHHSSLNILFVYLFTYLLIWWK